MAINIVPKSLRDELVRVAHIRRDWITWEHHDDRRYRIQCHVATPITAMCKDGADYISMWSMSVFFADGPKVFRPTADQVEAMAHIDVNITLEEYAQPYPTILVQLPKYIGPFHSVLVHHSTNMLSCLLLSDGNLRDICTVVGVKDGMVEMSVRKFDIECTEDQEHAVPALRVGINSCLALANYDTHTSLLFPKEVESDQGIVRKKRGSPAAGAAAARLAAPAMLVSFSREVNLHSSKSDRTNHTSTDREVKTHWRRGHWAMQPYGPGGSLRKRILRKPVLVRADRFAGDLADTETTYKG